MKAVLRAAFIACVIYTVLVSFFLLGAFFGRVPNDGGMLVFLTALPTSLIADAAGYWRLREPLAAVLHQPVTDRLAMSLDAIVGWFMGCIQYGLLGVIVRWIWRANRKPRVPA